jgi:phosphohistidine phosphatase SixA
MMRRPVFSPAGVVCLGLSVSLLAPAAAPAAVFVVRHAEKQSDANEREVPLSEAGRARAKRLAEILRDARIVTIYATDTVRALATAEPLAEASRIEVTLYDAGPEGARSLAKGIRQRHRGQNVLVVGHSNTIGPLLQALGCREPVAVSAPEYDGLWIVVPAPAGGAPVLLRLRQ